MSPSPDSTPAGNRTSQAVEKLADHFTDSRAVQAISKKYNRMQDALEWLRENDTATMREQQKVIKDALEYDPLRQ